MINIIFLIYCARSGSTLLSRLLDEYSDIGVTIETRFMKDLLDLKQGFEKQETAEVLFRRLEKSDKFSNLNIGSDDFIDRFDGKHTVSSIAESILDAYFSREKPQSRAWIVKDSANVYYMNQILKEMPDSRFIHIIRDGRAVLNSMLNTVDPYTRKSMSIDTINTARYWKKYITCADTFKEEHPEAILEMQYENLITNTEAEINKIRKFIGLKCGETEVIKNTSVNYFDKIPEPEKEIHHLVMSKPEISRLDAWEDKLPIPDKRLFEYITGTVLTKKGYRINSKTSLYDILTDPSLRGLYLSCNIRRVMCRLKMEKLDSLIWYIKRPGLYTHLLHRLKDKLLLPAEDDTSSRALHWCESLDLNTDAAVQKITGKQMGPPIEEKFSEIFKTAESRAKACPVKMGGPGDLNLLYYIAKHISASRVIETGVAYGWSSLALLLAIKDQKNAKLISTDIPYVRMNNDAYVGCVIADDLKPYWKVIRLADRQALPQALAEQKQIDLCHYDSDKSYRGRMWAYPRLWSALRSGGIFISDDIGDNIAFHDFAVSLNISPVVVRMKDAGGTMKYVGVLLKK